MSKFTKKAGGSAAEGEGRLIFVRPADLFRAGFTGVVAEGTFAGASPNQFDDGKDDFKIIADQELVIKGEDKNGKKYEEVISPGDSLIVNGAGNLNYLMREVNPGSLCQISYSGKNTIQKGPRKGSQAHTFEVLYE